MTLMVIGEICNFVAYAFADAVLGASRAAHTPRERADQVPRQSRPWEP